MSDTDYNKSAGYLKEQELYQQNDLVDGELVPFLNIRQGLPSEGCMSEARAAYSTTCFL